MHKLHCEALEAKMKSAGSDEPLDADHVFALMTDKYRISRNIRAQWYLQTLNTRIQTEAKTTFEDFQNEIDIVSIYSTALGDAAQAEFVPRNFKITPNSQFKFFSRKYSFAYILDLSTSVSNVDIQHSSVLTDEIFPALSNCLRNLIQPFIVPGSCFRFSPEIYISIVVYSPFYSGDKNNVIVHGHKLCILNIEKLLQQIKERVYEFIEELRSNIKIEGSRLDCAIHRQYNSNLVSADLSLVNMIRFGLLTLSLLPENSHEGIVIVTDGSFSFPDSNTLESALGQLRLSMISCSFIQIGSPAHPDSAFGQVPYNDFMKFLSAASFGAYISISPDYVCDFSHNEFNVFHKAFLVWSFHYDCSSFVIELRRPNYQHSIWCIDNPYFYSANDDFAAIDKKDQHMICKRLKAEVFNASLSQIVTYRLREGFTIKKVHFRPAENKIEMLLVLPWRHNVNIEYNIISSYQPDANATGDDEEDLLEISYEIMVEGSYSFLHDLTCFKKPFKSIYRGTTIKQFWNTLKSFTDSDKLGIHFHNFAKNELYRSMPESVKKGVPLFYLPPNANRPEVQFANDAHSKFSHYWKRICLLDVNMCQRSSLHTFQVNLLLRHDTPLPEFLYQPNPSGRYDNIQCNQAMSVLSVMLKEWSSFVLLENHSYIKLIGETYSPTCSFYLVRVVSQPPCIVLHLAFIGGTSSCLRNQIISELTHKLKQCKLPQRNLSSSLVQNSAVLAPKEETITPPSDDTDSSQSIIEVKSEPQEGDIKVRTTEADAANVSAPSPVNSPEKRTRNLSGNISCFILLDRPIERMLVRYERIPKDFFACYKYEEDLKAINNDSHASSLCMFQTLTRYLCHKRFIWSTHHSPHTARLSIMSVSKILSVLTMKRIHEGFHLAYNDGGIVNLVMEVSMRDPMGGSESPCIVQYIIFPSNVFVRSKDSFSVDNDYDEESSTDNSEHLVVTECWVEPQNGFVASAADDDGASAFLQGRDFDQISVSFFRSDKEVLSSLLTYEHLLSFTNFDPECPMCPDELYQPIPSECPREYHPEIPMAAPELHRINHQRYTFNFLELLNKSQQALIKFSMLSQTFEISDDITFEPLSNLNDCKNMVLYSEFLIKLLHMHDKELELSHADSVTFIEMANQRLLQSGGGRGELFTNFHLLIADPFIKFKCFCKQISANCLMVTILPFSYKVVRKLSFIAEPDKRNDKLISELNEQYGSLVVPIFVYKLTFSNLSNILLNTREGEELVASDSWNLFFDYSLPCNKFFDIAPRPLTDEIALEDFCKSVEIMYWNSFTDAVYRSLQYELELDNRDVTMVINKIAHRTMHYLNITEFLMYTCKHLRPLIATYVERFPDQSFQNLENCIRNWDAQHPDEPFEAMKVADIFKQPNCGNCHPNDLLKSSFASHIQTHFSPIPGQPSNYYFFNYENIQRTTFSLGGVDPNVQQRKEHLLAYYRDLEDGPGLDLCNLTQMAHNVHARTEGGQDEFITTKDEDQFAEHEMDFNRGLPIALKPFFLGFSCSISCKSGPQFLKTTSIPTCLFELLSAKSDIDLEEIQLENLQVMLNFEVITQNYELSMSEGNQVAVLVDGILEGIDIRTLDEFQMYKYLQFIHRINWLIRDEIVSVSHNGFPVSPPTLQMVVDHIQKTGKSNNSQIDKVELKFIIDDDTLCLEQLKDMLKELQFANFQLANMGDFYYVIHRSLPEPEQDISALIFTSSKKESFERENCLIFNEELFDERLMNELVSEYTIEDDQNSNLSPNFWLILLFEKDAANNCIAWLYFHSRQNIYLYGLQIFNQLKKSLEMLVKKINQKVLLDRLDETRDCDDLLITTEDKDPYTKANIRSALNSTPVSHLNIEEPELEMTEDKNYRLKKNFTPGSFACDVVWMKHFPLHPRLHGKEGLPAIRSVLSSFKVGNRHNLFVYKEKSGSVFYMRIYEIECSKHLFNEKFNYSLSDSSTTVSELTEINNCFYDNIITSNDFCHNDSLLRADSDRDTDSIASFNNIIKPMDRIGQQCILLNVHGVTEPGVFIKEDMVGALQKKLDEAVLDNLILMLARNPLSKFTYEDVCFIQSQNSSFENFYFVINENYLPYLTNIKSYIRQNLSTFMYSPKYTDSNSEFHFKLFKNEEFHCILDEDVFILHYQQESGKDSKGVVCVILSIVSKEKIDTNLPASFVLSKSDVNDFIFGNFDNITSCYSHLQENTNARFYINFQVWSSGKIDTEEHLKGRLIDTIRQSLWDFNLEFNIFKLCSFEDNRNTWNSMSEPSTPKKLSDKRERRSGLSIIQQNVGNFDDTKFFSTQQLWKRPDTTSSPQTAVSKESYFDFEINLDKAHDLGGTIQEAKNREMACLSHMINVVVKPWLDFGKQKQVPSLKKYVFNIVQKNSISTIIKEFGGVISNPGGDMSIHFLMSNGQNYCEFDLNSEALVEEGNHLMVLLRHEALWNTKHLHADFENSFTKLYHKLKYERTLCFPPVFSTSSSSSSKSGNDSSSNLNMSSEPNRSQDEGQKCIAPRQKFLLLYVEDRYIQLYLYNWSSSTSIVGIFSSLIIWHNSRSLLQQSFILQKAGIFHHLPFKRHSFEDILELSKVNSKDLNLPQLQNLNIQSTFSKEKPNLGAFFKNTDLLLKHTNPLGAIKECENKNLQNKGDSIFDSKNYSFIFSNFESPTSARNLFDCFNGQFNSNYNLYVKDLKDLSKVWQLHGSKLNTTIMEKITSHVKKYGRLSHFCLTPFLFSVKWRYSIAQVRDHTLPVNNLRSRHMSGGPLLRANSTEHEFGLSGLNSSSNKRSRRKSGPPNMLEHSTMTHRGHMDEYLDSAVCPHYIHEYVQYLQSLGFSSIKSQKNGTLVTRNLDRFKTGVAFSRKTSYKNEVIKFYSIKTLPGGFFLFEIGFCEPYVYSYLYSFDSARFSTWNKSDSFISHMNTTNFLDELDSIKARMHLHSFTYDYHLRAIHSYISGRQLFFHQGYHLISFLDDFIKYYQKAPNYARNHVYSDYIKFESTRINAEQLYRYISDNNKLYELDVFQMNSSNLETGRLQLIPSQHNRECVLIHLSSHRIPYDDENNIRQEDNFDVGVVITNQRQSIFMKDNNLCLKFFLLLTSQRELFPKLSPFGDSKGAFRAIRLLPSSLSTSQSRKNSIPKAPDGLESSITRPPVTSVPFSAFLRPFGHDGLSSDSTYSGICDEKINYLGYFNAHEIVMLRILNEKVNETKEQLKRIVTMAEIDCRRDCLWNCLISSNVEQRAEVPISLDEFNELLSLVKSIRLDEYDLTLAQFYSFNHQWYKTLAQKLELKFEFTHRKFMAKDNTYCKMAFFKTNCKDCFILFDLKNTMPFVDFKIVFKKSPDIEIDVAFLQDCNPQFHELVEEFINSCTSHMWSVML